MSFLSTPKISLPVLPAAEGPPAEGDPAWNGFMPIEGLPTLGASEPLSPQGIYNSSQPEEPLAVPELDSRATGAVELLAPAGGPDAAFAAIHYGADAIYLGLKKFSARAEAENFTLADLDEVTAYAHSLEPRRRVFVTVNTLIRQDELAELIDDLAALEEIGVDAVILQDLGVYRAIRKYFPSLEIHGSTQMAVHNRAGAEALRRLGFSRVVLARELTFEEVHDVTASAGIETEVFIHGALCYAYSGLCLFSAQTLGRSGNRGKCAYSCRDSYEVADAPLTLRDGTDVKRDPRSGFPFSMKDLALPDHLPALRGAGVSCFKIEGRKKSPLYVATTTDYYRRLIDGRLAVADRPSIEADLQTVFSRPWTRLFVQSHKDKEVADRDTVGHRGARIGTVTAVTAPRTVLARLQFRTERQLERHDGLQIDLPALGKPFGFAVDRLWVVKPSNGRREAPAAKEDVYVAPKGALVEVILPADHPDIPRGAPVYCSSSQEVKQKFRHERPKPGLFRTRWPLRIHAALTAEALTLTAAVDGRSSVSAQIVERGPFPRSRNPEAVASAVRATFERLGGTPFTIGSLTWENDGAGFIAVSRLNKLRRELVAKLEDCLRNDRRARLSQIKADLTARPTTSQAGVSQFAWSLKVDRLSFLDAFDRCDWDGIDELVIDITRDHPTLLRERLDALATRMGRERIRLALPALTRAWEEKALLQKVESLRKDGWKKWEAANLSAFSYLGITPCDASSESSSPTIDLATDWSVYVLNRLAALQLLEMGVSRFALSPEDGIDNWRSLLAEFVSRAVLIVYQDTPLFLAESCAYANLVGGCPGKANCRFESMDMVSSHGEKVTALDYHCRTIVLNQGPYCLSTRLRELANAGAMSLRADFVYRAYSPELVRERWRLIREGKAVPGGHAANFKRGIR